MTTKRVVYLIDDGPSREDIVQLAVFSTWLKAEAFVHKHRDRLIHPVITPIQFDDMTPPNFTTYPYN